MDSRKWIIGIALVALLAATAAFFEMNSRRAKESADAAPVSQGEQGPTHTESDQQAAPANGASGS